MAGYCAAAGIPFEAVRVDAAGYAAEAGMSVEEAARHLRYEALERAAEHWDNEKLPHSEGEKSQNSDNLPQSEGEKGQNSENATQSNATHCPGGDCALQSGPRQQTERAARDASCERKDHQAAA